MNNWVTVVFGSVGVLFAVGCGGGGDDAVPSAEEPQNIRIACEVDGKAYAVNDVIPFADGKQSCVCLDDGSVGRCTGATTDAVCERDGKSYAAGDIIPVADGTQSCVCLEDGSIGRCTGVIRDQFCKQDGQTYSAGDSIPFANGTQSCRCLDDGSIGQCTGAK